MDNSKSITTHNDMQRMNMCELYSDLYNDLLQVFVMLAIGLLIFLWTGSKKNKEVKALKNKVKDLTSSNEVLMIKVDNLVAKLDARDYRIEALQVIAALKQERILQTESQREQFKMQNSMLQDQIQGLSKKMTTSMQEADEARKSHEEDMKRRRNIFGMKKKEILNDNLIGQLRAANEQLIEQLAAIEVSIESGFISTSASSALEAN